MSKITKSLCNEVKKRGTWTPVMCTMCSFRKKCQQLDYQDEHEGNITKEAENEEN